MKGNSKEIRDPIHNFIHVDRDEMSIIDSRAFQRLRHIHQLAMTYLVYPGATHRRFEHSLGVMELAGRAFDAITARDNVNESARRMFPRISDPQWICYWRKVVRLAALCHDLGHPPFSHAAEKELLPKGTSHETLTKRVLESPEMEALFKTMVPPVAVEDVVKLALGRKELPDVIFSDSDILFSEIITGDSLGVDRMDYLLRDAYHSGVAYGKFDHFRLLETLRIISMPKEPDVSNKGESSFEIPPQTETSGEPSLGLLIGGIHSSEALLLARYFMYAQVYFHRVRIAYNFHLASFLKAWLPGGQLPITAADHLLLTDNEVNTAMRQAADDPEAPGHDAARRIVNRDHFRRLYDFTPAQIQENPILPAMIERSLVAEFGPGNFLLHQFTDNKAPQNFPVQLKNGESDSSVAHSAVLKAYPKLSIHFILVDARLQKRAADFLISHHGLTP